MTNDKSEEQPHADSMQQQSNDCEAQDKIEGMQSRMEEKVQVVGCPQPDNASGELMVTVPVRMPLSQFNQMQVQQCDDMSDAPSLYMIDIPQEVKIELQGVLENPVATEKIKSEVKYLLSKPKFTVNELRNAIETIHDVSTEMQEDMHIDYTAGGNNETVAMERSLDYDMLWSEWEEIKEKCMQDDVMQNWSKAVMKNILNKSIEYILKDQFNEILSQGCLLQKTKKLASQVSINNKGEITTNFQFDTKKYRKKI